MRCRRGKSQTHRPTVIGLRLRRAALALTIIPALGLLGCGGDTDKNASGQPANEATTQSAKKPTEKTSSLPTLKEIVGNGTTPESVCRGTFEEKGVSEEGKKVGITGLAIAECAKDDELFALGVYEAQTDKEAPEISKGAGFTFAGEGAGQPAISGNVTCLTSEAETPQEICSQPLGRLVLVAAGPKGNRSLSTSPAQSKGLPEFARWVETGLE